MMGKEYSWIGTRIFSNKPNLNNLHISNATTDLRSLVRTVYCLVRQRLPNCVDDEIPQFWQLAAVNHPIFTVAMTLADNSDYDGMCEVFSNLW